MSHSGNQVAFLAMFVLLVGIAFADEPQPPASPGADLWDKYIKDRPNTRILDKFELIPCCQFVGG